MSKIWKIFEQICLQIYGAWSRGKLLAMAAAPQVRRGPRVRMRCHINMDPLESPDGSILRLHNWTKKSECRFATKFTLGKKFTANNFLPRNDYNEKLGEASRCGRTTMPSTRYGERDSANKIKFIKEIKFKTKIQRIIQKFQKNKSKIHFIVIKAISDSHSLDKICWLVGWCLWDRA